MKHLLLFSLLFFGLLQQPADIRTVKKVVDGDTVWVSGKNNGPDEKIRLIGIDAHETRNTARKKAGFYGKEATAYLKKQVLGKRVRLEYDIRRYDQYRRTLAYIHLENGRFINADLVRNGYAVVMTVSPNVKYADKFILYQQQARNKKQGLWGVKLQ
jgi:micrococcal nuclease